MQKWEQEVAKFEIKYAKEVNKKKDLGTEVNHATNIVRRNSCNQRKIVQLVYGLAPSRHQLSEVHQSQRRTWCRL